MAKKRNPDPKLDALRQHGSLNPNPHKVTDPLFAASDFFDSRDLVQVKYEMVRRVTADELSIKAASELFGFSRPAFYKARGDLEQDGLSGLVPKKRGPRSGHKLRPEVVEFLREAVADDRGVRSQELVERVEQRFGIRVHPRSIERALSRGQKKLR